MTKTNSTYFKQWALASAAGFVLSQGLAFAQDKEVAFDIEPAPLSEALNEFGLQSGKEILFVDAETKGKQTKGVAGTYAPMEALGILLADASVDYRTNDLGTVLVGTIAVREEAPEPRPLSSSASLREEQTPEPFRVAQVDERESARRSEPEVIEPDSERIEDTIVVTGTNIRGASNPTVPIVSFDREALSLSGISGAADIGRLIPQNFGGSLNPTASLANNPVTDTIAGNSGVGTASGFDLRGLGAGTTLTLLNGRRMALGNLGTSVDVTSLPASIFDRVDVISDGASAIYGADAVGGVVNLVTRQDYEGFEARAFVGTTPDGKKDDYQVGLLAGGSIGRLNTVVSFDYSDNQPIRTRDRDYIDQSIATLEAITPDEQLFSVFASANYEFSDKINLRSDLFYSENDAFITTRLGSTSDQTAETVFSSTNLTIGVSDDWTVDAFFDYAQEKTDTLNTFATSVTNPITDSKSFVYELTASGKVLSLASGDVKAAVGAQRREEEISNPSFTSGDFSSRDVSSIYGELIVPILGQEQNSALADEIVLSLAGRYEDFSDVGGEFSPKVGLAWTVNDLLQLRASYSESFRAPPIIASTPRDPLLFLAPVFDPTLDPANQDPRLQPGQVIALWGSNFNDPFFEQIEPETAETVSAGVTFSPPGLDALSFELGYFSIDFQNRIENIDPFTTGLLPELDQFVIRDPSDAVVQDFFDRGFVNFLPFFATDPSLANPTPDDIQAAFYQGFGNQSSLAVEGFDIAIDYSQDFYGGDLIYGLDATYFTEYEFGTGGGESVDVLDDLFRPLDFRARATATWSNSSVSIFGALNYDDGYENSVFVNPPENISSRTTVDLALSLRTDELTQSDFLSGITATLAIQNLFNEQPPFAQTVDGFNFDSSNASPLDRYVSLSLNKRF